MFSQLFIAAVLAVSAQGPGAVAATCLRSYTVQEGDYCDKVSQAQNVSTYQLAVLNSNAVNSACTNLLPGQTLCLAENADEDCNSTYTVLNGDSCDSIAAANALNTTILTLNNPQIDQGCSNIYPGEVLCTSKTVRVAPIPAAGVTVEASHTTIIVTPTATPVSTHAPVVSATPASAAATPNVTSAAAAAASSAADEEDDSDLPFCDEL
ncbi:hypothetical protein BJ912DRAFT_664798 [Pholiota molesta]|nr:hypothetical protein BJ912DRAFT_664798 [Pholiota molesta]